MRVIPEVLLVNLSQTTQVDHYAKVLHGKKMFYLLLYGILENEKLSQRSLEDTFNDPIFKNLFDLDPSERIARSSISEKLSKIDSDYFVQIYQCLYTQFQQAYPDNNSLKYNLVYVESSMMSEAATRLVKGIDHNNGKKSVKYSVAFDGLLPCYFDVFTDQKYSSEDIALPEAIHGHIKKENGHQNIYVIDRGVQSTRTMNSFSKSAIGFIVRAKQNRKHQELVSLIVQNQQTDLGELTLVKDSKVLLYTGKPINNKKGKIHYTEQLIETPFRLIVANTKDKNPKSFWFITNNFELSAKEITKGYRRRWDIEVFFRFIKQELHVSHLMPLNNYGIKVMLYMTLIVAMLILIYKLLTISVIKPPREDLKWRLEILQLL